MLTSFNIFCVSVPLWFYAIYPYVWLILFPLNIIVNSAVLILFLFILDINQKKAAFKSCIWKLCLLSFLAHLNSAVILFFLMYFEIYNFVLSLAGVLFSAALTYYFNYKITFASLEAKISDIKRISFAIALFTAPYYYLLTSDIFTRS